MTDSQSKKVYAYKLNETEYSFSGKSVIINGEEFLYKDVRGIKHSSAKQFYMFKIGDEWHTVYYDESHKNVVDKLFKQIATLVSKRAAAMKAKASEAKAKVSEIKGEKAEEKTNDSEANVPTESTPAESAETPKEDTEDTTSTKEDSNGFNVIPSEEDVIKDQTENALAEEKRKKLKKSFIIFVIILAVMAIICVAYYFVFGLPGESSPTTVDTTTQQYNDVDELIQDMQD